MKNQELITDPTKRQEFVFLFDVTDGNPNGDPDAGNAPRFDPETGQGLVTDVALKRKVRNHVVLTTDAPMFIQSEVALNTLKAEAAKGVTPSITSEDRKNKRPIPRLRERLCEEYYDIRMFGAVLATGDKEDRLNAGQVRGPVQFTFARSIDPIFVVDCGISRNARTTEKRMESGPTELGRKTIVPYGLYRAYGFINPFLAEKTGVSRNDLEVFWSALCNLFDFDQSAARAQMDVCGVYVFTHQSKLGSSPSRHQFNRIRIAPRRSTGSDELPPRLFTDYVVEVDETDFPDGVTLSRLVG